MNPLHLLLIALTGWAVYQWWPLLTQRSTTAGVPSRDDARAALAVVKRRLLAAGQSVDDTTQILAPVAHCLESRNEP